jgi:RNA polymerase sigma-70 factor (ECF subfamily)
LSQQSRADLDEELLAKTKAYLECRSRGLDPSPALMEAWDRFYWAYQPRIRALLGKWRLPAVDREDCLQEVWVEVVAHLGRFQHDPRRGRLSTWLTTLTRNKAVDSIRRRNRHPSQPLEAHAGGLPDPVPGPVADCERRWIQARVRGVLDGLAERVSERSFRVLYLRWIEGRTVPEIADAMGLSPEQVRLRAHRMKQRFRDLFECSMAGGSARMTMGSDPEIRNKIS